jgi:hypothetical protein
MRFGGYKNEKRLQRLAFLFSGSNGIHGFYVLALFRLKFSLDK